MRRLVWDVPTRVFHWGLAGSFAAAMLSGDEPSSGVLHVAVGTGVAALLVFRLGWGFVGGRWSRWSTLGQEPGHDPVASVSVLFALFVLAGLTVSGVLVLGGEEFRGPLAGWSTPERALAAHFVHRWLAWGLVGWLALHLAGVARKSWEHRENLVRGMVDGRKSYGGEPVRARAGVGVVLVAVAAGAAAATTFGAAEPAGPSLARHEGWDEACGECHLAFHPSLLKAEAWDRMLASEDHFGEYLGLDPATVTTLGAFARAESADQGRSEHAARVAAEPETTDRVTATRMWTEVHAELSDEVFERSEVGGRVRCGACHPDAEQGTFDGRAADVPEPEPARLVGRVM